MTVELVGELWGTCLVAFHASVVQFLPEVMSFPSLTSTQPIGTSGLSNASFAYCMTSFINVRTPDKFSSPGEVINKIANKTKGLLLNRRLEIFSATSVEPFIGIESIDTFITGKTIFPDLELGWLLIEIISGLTFNFLGLVFMDP